MTAQNLIAVGGLLAAAFSALAAAFAVQQSKLQRTTLTKPQLIVTKITIPVFSDSDAIFSLGTRVHEFKVPIKNVGLGTALNLKYSWNFDYLKAIDACGFARVKSHPVDILSSVTRYGELNNTAFVDDKDSNEYLYISFYNDGTFTGHSIAKVNTDIEYIIPITQDKTVTVLKLPYLIPMLIINQLESIRSFPDVTIFEHDAGILTLEYEDISGYRFSLKFACTLRLIKYKGSVKHGSEAVYELKLHRIKKLYQVKKFLGGVASKFKLLKKRFNAS